MWELLCILAVIVLLVRKLDVHNFERTRRRHKLARWTATGLTRREPSRPQPKLWIEGTIRLNLRSKKFIKGFGMNPQHVHDIRIYACFGSLEQFPRAVANVLLDLYERGSAVGTDIMALLFHGRDLQEGEAVYFALVEARPEPRVVAFVDKLRAA